MTVLAKMLPSLNVNETTTELQSTITANPTRSCFPSPSNCIFNPRCHHDMWMKLFWKNYQFEERKYDLMVKTLLNLKSDGKKAP